MPGPYSAGSIFLQIVPSFRGVPEKIAAEARKWGTQAGREFDSGFESEVGKGVPSAMAKGFQAGRGEARKAGNTTGKDFAGTFIDTVQSAVVRANREISALRIDGDNTDAMEALDRVQERIKKITSGKDGINVYLDDTTIHAELTALEEDLRRLAANGTTIEVKANTAAALQEVRQARMEIDALAGTTPTIEVDADTSAADAAMGATAAAAEGLDGQTAHIEVDVDGAAEAAAELGLVEHELDKVDGANRRVATSAGDAGNAFRAFSGVVLGVAALGPAVVPAIVAMTGALAAAGPLGVVGVAGIGTAALGLSGISAAVKALGAAQKSAATDADTYAKGVRNANNSVISAQQGLDNAIAASARNQEQAARAVTNAQQAATDARAKAARDSVASARAIADAEQGVADARTKAARDAAASARSIADAEQGVTDARLRAARDADSSARAIATADRAVASAEQQLATAQQSAQRAQEGLTQAREDYAKSTRDLALSARGGALAEQAALLDIADAQAKYNEATRAGSAATAEERQRAFIALEQQKLSLDEIRARNSDINDQQLENARTGVEGSDQVVSAQERLISANQSVASAEQGVRDAQQSAADARTTAAQRQMDDQRAIADAQQKVADARAAADLRAMDDQRAIADAQQKLADAQANAALLQQADARAIQDADQRVADARAAQALAATQGQQAIADAQRQLVQAQANLSDAVDKTSASQRNLNDAMAKLGPAGQEFARFIFGLAPYLAQLREAAGEGFLPGLQEWFQIIVGTYGPQILGILSALSQAMGDLFSQFGAALLTPPFHALFDMIQTQGPVFIGMMGQILTNLGLGVASLVTAMVPLSFLFGGWLVEATAAFARWAAALPQTTGFQNFLDTVAKDGPLVGAFLLAAADAFIAIGKALLPYGETLLRVLTGLLNWIAGMDPAKLQAIAVGLTLAFLAFQTIVGLESLVSSLEAAVTALSAGMGFFAGSTGVAAVAADGLAVSAGAADAAVAPLAITIGGIVGIIGLVIIALALIGVALYEAYTHFDWFRNMVDGVWAWIKAAAQAVADWFMTTLVPIFVEVWAWMGRAAQNVWDQVLHPVFTLLQQIFTDVMNGLSWAWTNIGAPLFSLIGQIVMALWEGFFKPVFTEIGVLFMYLWNQVIVPGWNGYGKPIFDAMMAVLTFLWEYVFKPIFIAIGEAFRVLVIAMQWAWDNILHPVFNVIMDIAKVMLQILVVVVFGAIAFAWSLLVTTIRNLWNDVLKPTWDAVQTAAGWLWNNVLHPIFDAIGAGWNGLLTGMRWVWDHILEPMWHYFEDSLHHLMDYFGITKDVIQGIWDGVKAVVATPINFIIGMVFNKGLFKAWNWAIDALHLPGDWKAPDWPQITGPGIPTFAAGGRIPGAYMGPTADNVLATSGGMPIRVNPHEWIQPVSSVDYYGADFMEAIQRRKIPREALGMIPGFAAGGTTWPQLDNIRKQQFPGSVLTSGYRAGANDYHGRGEAIDIGWPGNDVNKLHIIADALMKAYPQATEIIHNPNGSRKNGKNVPASLWGAATWAAHKTHVHWAMTPEALGGGAVGGGNLVDAAGNALGSITGFLGKVWSTATDVLGSIKDSITGPLGDFTSKYGDSGIVKMAHDVPGNLLDKMWGAASAKVSDFFSNLVPDITPGGGDLPGIGKVVNGPIQEQVRSVFNAYGWGSGAQWDAASWVINKESGWRPNAQNPTSTASGLGQFINGTWAAYRPQGAGAYPTMKSAPIGFQAAAIAKYMGSRYHDPIGAQKFWAAHNWYGEGGEVVPELMDTGGWIHPGLNVIMNKTGRPEPVINPGTLDSLHSIAENGGTQALVRDINLPIMPQATPEAIAGEIMHSLTVARRGGRY